MPVSTAAAVTVALGTTAPVASRTVPVTVAVSTCADAVNAEQSTHKRHAFHTLFFIFIRPPHFWQTHSCFGCAREPCCARPVMKYAHAPLTPASAALQNR